MAHPPKHKRTLNVFVLTMLCTAVVISLRNLPLTAEYGLGAIFFYLVAAITFMIPYALVSAELASGWPKAGGVYVWVKEAMGNRWGFFAIWMQWFHNVTWYPAMLAFIGAGIVFPFNPELAHNKLYILSVVIIGFWGVTFLNFFGIHTSALFSAISLIIGAILPGILLIALGFWWVIRGYPIALNHSWSALIPEFHFSQFVFLAGMLLALSGLEANANHAREVINPRKNYPRAILGAAIITLTILILGSLSISIVIPRVNISFVSGVLEAFHIFFRQYHLHYLMPVVALFAVLGALGELNAWAIAGVKGLFVTTEYACLPPIFHKINKHDVPVNILFLQAILVTIAALVFLYSPNVNLSYWILSALSSQMYLIMYILMLISAIILRYKKKNIDRAYKIPGGMFGIWFVALLGCAAALFAITVGFIPPTFSFEIHHVTLYFILMLSGFVITCLIPLAIYSFRRPHWQLEVLEDIRKDIHSDINS